MTKAQIAQQALELPEQDRFELAHVLWASLDEPNTYKEPVTLPAWQRQLLDERLEASAPTSEDWEQVKAELWPERRSRRSPPRRSEISAGSTSTSETRCRR